MPNELRTLQPAEDLAFIRRETELTPVPFVPEISLHMAEDAIALWEATERMRGEIGLAPPFWAFAWAGGVAVTRYVLDHPELVAGRAVLDIAAGSGLVGVAAALRGAASVRAAEIDPYAVTAIGLNAEANGVRVEGSLVDLVDGDGAPAEVVLAGDVFYERAMAARFLPFLERAAARGATVIVGDPGRAYLPRDRFTALAAYQVPVVADLEDTAIKTTTVWRLG
ncbi:putative nicotinamide N-methyase [Streptomyces sp. 1114.5]|uniref:class I SAM-dependent methyltransferase n=1 Tax=unclassified Streptomyces TaxID=2593676 RepID=UPI000BD2A2F4|nr:MULTISPECIES: 50S ribosomal protein L11 methyltransferase [unclassified Streptomyces]RKT19537.1 putative nicotinamide N-methyase [Streptomyces sp. 1114.5]SOB85734.1 Predicted nicotinamide N-methyase [Streptomyces sp. 1331.2]